jgi:hypothetical protein
MPQPSIIKQNGDPVTTTSAHGRNLRANALNLTKLTCIPYSVQPICLTDECRKAHRLLNIPNENTKGVRRSPSSLFKISPNGMGSEDETSLTAISRHVR